jgi:Cu(I)/Ag(I) efflux system membrane protein CusA/SilA
VRFGENVLNVIERVKEKISKDIQPSLPKGVKIVTTYDRSDLIHRSINTLKEEIIKLTIAVSVVCLVFLFHLPSALVIILTLPVAIIISFISMYYLGVTSNIMSLSGIAIAIGAMVDASIIMVENAHKKMEDWSCDPKKREACTRIDVIIDAAKEVGPSLFFYRGVPAGLYTSGTGRQAFQASGIYQDVCDALCLVSGCYDYAGADDALHTGKDAVL